MALPGINSLGLSINLCKRCCSRLVLLKNTYSTQTLNSNAGNSHDGVRKRCIKNSFLQKRCQFVRHYGDRPVVNSTLDEEELQNFAKLAQSWWDERGEFAALHSMNKVRVPFIRDGLVYQREELSSDRSKPLHGLKIVDAGCGGGLLSESSQPGLVWERVNSFLKKTSRLNALRKKILKLAQSWWDERGEFAALHSINKVRVPFIRDGLVYQREELSPDRSKPLHGLKIVDAGCGGGLLSEPFQKGTSKLVWRKDYGDRPVVNSTLDEEELQNFAKLAQSWWDERGEFAALHSMNKVRVPFIRDGLVYQREELSPDRSKPLHGLKIVDAGCGGGLLSEPLARLGAFVIGVDPVEESTQVAAFHLNEDPEILPIVKYITGTIEDLVGTEAESFDAVVSSEVIEHVADYMSFIEACCALVKPGGSIFLTTMNKTQMAKYLAVYSAENIFGIVPQGTHDWEKFIPPDDLQSVLEKNNFDVRAVHGLSFNPLTLKWDWIQDTSMNYAIHAVKLDSGVTNEDSSVEE